MKALVCELCGSQDLIKQDGYFVCQHCNTKYSPEEAKKLIIEGKVDVSGSTVVVDSTSDLKNLYQLARRAKEENNAENAAKYYEMIMVKNPTDWEASFYTVYFQAMQCKIAYIESAANSITNCLGNVLLLIKNKIESPIDQMTAVYDVSASCINISGLLNNAAINHHISMDSSLRFKDEYEYEVYRRGLAAANILYTLGNHVENLFEGYEGASNVCTNAWKCAVSGHVVTIEAAYVLVKEREKLYSPILEYIEKIKKYDPSYTEPHLKRSTDAGCYVATAVYGSYDCPEVWTLRRFRDYTLAETWYGRAFIRTYYAISPTLVKWFGHTEWFKLMWKGRLDRMVQNLQNKGFENTPYEDKKW